MLVLVLVVVVLTSPVKYNRRGWRVPSRDESWVGIPSCPCSFFPHTYTSPATDSATEWSRPRLTAAMRGRFATRFGIKMANASRVSVDIMVDGTEEAVTAVFGSWWLVLR